MRTALLVLGTLFFLTGCGSVPTYQAPETVQYEIEGELANQSEAEKAVQVIEDNLAYAEAEDLDGYLSTILQSAAEETRAELGPFFEQYDLEHTILKIEVLEQEEERMLIQTQQQTVMIDSVEGAENYRNHIAEVNYTMVVEEGEWKIEETAMTDTTFID